MYPEPGHLMPTLGLAESLRLRGHSVCYFTTGEFRELVLGAGFQYCPMFSPLGLRPGAGDCFAVQNTGAHFMRRIADHLLATHQGRSGLLQLVLSEMRDPDFDLLVCDVVVFGFYFGQALSRSLHKPVVTLNTSLPHDDYDVPLSEMVLCPRELEIPGETRLLTNRSYGEPAIFRKRPLTAFPWSHIDSGKPLVYCCFGTQLRSYPAVRGVLASVVEAFKHLPSYQLVVTTGNLTPGKCFNEVPANVMMVRSVPQLEILNRASLMITHGGLGSIKEAVLAGVPMLVIPFHVDQPKNGSRVQHHGLGTACAPPQCSPEKIVALVRELVADRAVRRNVNAMGALFRERESEAPVAQLLGRLAS